MSTYWKAKVAVAVEVLVIMLIAAIGQRLDVPLYKSAFSVAAALLVALALMQVHMRRQVHQANYGNDEINPWDMRFVNSMFGVHGIWSQHKRAYEQSSVRSWFLGLFFAWIVYVAVALLDLIVRHH